MNEDLQKLRHTLAHVLASAVLDIYPEAKPTIGPSIEDGFYYDFDFGDQKISDEDLSKIESRMKEIIPLWTDFKSREMDKDSALAHFSNNEYKQELIEGLSEKGEQITFYKSGDFEDLCRGGHLENPSTEINPDGFKLSRVAGAYWRGDENNKMLTRIYGLAFPTQKELEGHLKTIEEAGERDHRKLGKELDLFIFSDLVGPGLPLFTPKGTLIRDLLDSFVWELREKQGYQRVDIPHLTKKDLYEKSGHWDKFGDELFHVKTREGHEFVIKPMNCPHHTQIFARKPHSYREMPQRYANTTKVYRDEQTGELSGISRVRSITQDDAHVFCRYIQAKEEIGKIWDIVDEFYGAFNLPLEATISLHDPEKKEKYLGTPEIWIKAENELRELTKERGVGAKEFVGEAAFYGPKVDFIAKDALGRTHQVATIQFDMNMPENFDLTCINEKGDKERIVMLHAAIMGSVERFMAPLIEHYAGAFPLWLSPEQIRILPISEKHNDFAESVREKLIEKEFRAEIDSAGESLGKKISKVKKEKVPYYLVIGDKEAQSGTLKIENRGGKAEELELSKLITKLKKEVSSRS